MKNVQRIGSTRNLPARQASRERGSNAPTSTASPATYRSDAALGATVTSFRPLAGFLAQYVDQHFPWPRAPLRKERQRQRATQAYITADMLPDLLAETLRLRPIDRKL